MTVRRGAVSGAWLMGVAAIVVWLGSLQLPEPDGQWTLTVFGTLRRLTVAAGAYIVCLGSAQLLTGCLRSPALAAFVDAATFAPLRRCIRGAAVFVALAAAPADPVAASASDPDPVLRHFEDEESLEPGSAPVLKAEMPPAAGALPPAPTTWTVQPGDHFWSIAQRVLMARLGEVPAEREIARYWLQLIESNRSRLVDADNADLLYPAQLLQLPEL